MFPYPSGSGLHVGHPRGYTATDVYSRFKKLQGFNVLHPMGWDAFGLPAENYAIKNKIHPEKVVADNIVKFKDQLNNFDLSYDWDREINTTDPKYYRWTQFIFLKLFERGLAYEAETPINFCPSCQTGLANEEVVAGRCERCKTEVERKNIRQWILKITEYADRLLSDLDGLDWPKPIKEMQRNWIGRSEGSNVRFDIIVSEAKSSEGDPVGQSQDGIATSSDRNQTPRNDNADSIEVYTTRADTLFGCTWVVLAPEHKLIEKLKVKSKNRKEIEEYIEKSKNKSDLERTELQKEKTGIELKGIKAINPINGKEVAVWIADYVLGHYGTGAVMVVPAHDERDFEFAKKYNIEIPFVIFPENGSEIDQSSSYVEYGILKNSAEFDGLDSKTAMKKITEKLKESGHGDFAVNYKLRDWVFSRQRYWGEPIPIVHCDKCGIVPVPEKDLPVILPHVENYQPTGDGTFPLSNESDPAISEWINTTCPKCGSPAKRETNTMPQWAGSCWYYIAYLMKNGDEYIWDREKIDPWLPIDLYVGGAEHAVLHLLYARFWHKVLYDEKLVGTKEPFQKLISVGTILGIDGQKMSKSRGNVINPDPLLEKFGSDALKMYELYIGPFSQMAKWNQNGIVGMHRFLQKVEKLSDAKISDSNAKNLISINKAIKKVSEDIESFDFNTAISTLIETFDQISKNGWDRSTVAIFLTLLSPFAPKMTKEVSDKIDIALGAWPEFDPRYIVDEKVTIAVQINGKVRDQIEINIDDNEEDIKKVVLLREKVKAWIPESGIKKFIYIKGKIISIVV